MGLPHNVQAVTPPLTEMVKQLAGNTPSIPHLSDRAVVDVYVDYYRQIHPGRLDEVFDVLFDITDSKDFGTKNDAHEMIADVLLDLDRDDAMERIIKVVADAHREKVEALIESAKERMEDAA